MFAQCLIYIVFSSLVSFFSFYLAWYFWLKRNKILNTYMQFLCECMKIDCENVWKLIVKMTPAKILSRAQNYSGPTLHCAHTNSVKKYKWFAEFIEKLQQKYRSNTHLGIDTIDIWIDRPTPSLLLVPGDGCLLKVVSRALMSVSLWFKVVPPTNRVPLFVLVHLLLFGFVFVRFAISFFPIFFLLLDQLFHLFWPYLPILCGFD